MSVDEKTIPFYKFEVPVSVNISPVSESTVSIFISIIHPENYTNEEIENNIKNIKMKLIYANIMGIKNKTIKID